MALHATDGQLSNAEIDQRAEKSVVRARALELELSQDIADELGRASVFRGKSKTRLFREFLLEFGKNHNQEKPLFNSHAIESFPVKDEVAAIELAYSARSGHVHAANPLEAIALEGLSPRVSVESMIAHFSGTSDKQAPSIIWLERIVSLALKQYILSHDS
jgi:hypothetical protein